MISMSEHNTICLNMIVKDESNVILGTLQNITKYIKLSYWVISDTGSSDDTKEIITSFFKELNIPGELVEHQWIDFGHNRTQALQCAFNKSDYLLIFDADDKICGDFIIPFQTNGINKYEKCDKYDKYMLRIGIGLEYYRPLLINNRKPWRFRGILHEFLDSFGIFTTTDTVYGDYYIDSGRTGNRSTDKNKYIKDARLLEAAYITEKEDPNGISGRYAFYCARSFKDSGLDYFTEAIKWYKIVLGIPNHWTQEKYYAALEIGILSEQLNEHMKLESDNSVLFWLKASEYDNERIEGVSLSMLYYLRRGMHVIVNALYTKFKTYNTNKLVKGYLCDKLFLLRYHYEDRLEFFNSISAFYANDYESGYACCKQIIINNILHYDEIKHTLMNLYKYKSFINKDIDVEELFTSLDNLFFVHNELAFIPEIIELWSLLFNKNEDLIRYNVLAIQSVCDTKTRRDKAFFTSDKILISFTTCKRLPLFKKTVNSILNCWTDVSLINHWFCVDDMSCDADRNEMKQLYPFIEFYFKSIDEKGHRISMNIIRNKLKSTQSKYWIQMEDDFCCFNKRSYITDAKHILDSGSELGIKQIVFNRNYAEGVYGYRIKGELNTDISGVVLHNHKIGTFPYCNAHYWPHFTLNPSMILVEPIILLGDFNSPNQFFERDYADKWELAGYKTAFFNRITHRHIGRNLREHGDNAYSLNHELQFRENSNPVQQIDGFTFHMNKDQIGHDIIHCTGKSIIEMADMIINGNVENCVAFNSLGYFKREIVSLQNINVPGHICCNFGIYIKD